MAAGRELTIPRNIESLYFPLKSSIGLKYTSVALTSSIICLGTNTGSTYVFLKESLKLVKFIASKGGSIEILKFSKDEKLLAIVDSTGVVTCLEVKDEKHEFKVAKEIEDHKGVKITALTWDDDSARLFIGDERGIVTAVIVAPFKLPAGKFLSKSTVEVIVKGESPIVQLDFSKLKLLASSTTRTLLCHTDKSKYQQVGSKPRDGNYGSCFVHYGEGEYPVIYAARPGSRLWEVDFNGQVLATHQFKNLLACAPTKIYGLMQERCSSDGQTWDRPQSIAFPKLISLCDRYLICWSSYALYILDASLGKVAGWFDDIKGIKDLSCRDESIFIVNNDGEVFEFGFMTIKNCLNCLIGLSKFRQAAEVAVKAKEEVLRSVESYLTVDLETVKDQLVDLEDEAGKELCRSLTDLILQLQFKHDQVRAEIQERLNGLPSLDDSTTPCDSGVEDNDEVRSNQSETSSRVSLSRLSHVDVDRVLRRATNAVFNKIASTGFMKRALSDVTNEPKERPISPLLKDGTHLLRATTVAESGQEDNAVGLGYQDRSPRDNVPSDSSTAERKEKIVREMGNVELKLLDREQDADFMTGKAAQGKRPTNGKRRRKAKIVTVDFESPAKDDVFMATSYETAGKNPVRRILSSDSASSYTQISDVKRHGSLPVTINSTGSPVGTPVISSVDAVDAAQPHFNHSNFLQRAKQLVRKVIHTELPAPLDVGTNDDTLTQGIVTSQDKLTCLLVSENAMRSIPKFVDITAVCRNKLRDSRVLFSSNTVKKFLEDWAEKLAATVQDFSVAMANDIEKRSKKHKFTNEEKELVLMRTREEFFSNLGVAFSEISNLAVLCFEAGIFPASSADLTLIEKKLIENEKTFRKIRQEVNDILNKDDSEVVGNKESAVPQDAEKSTLLSLSQSYDYVDDDDNDARAIEKDTVKSGREGVGKGGSNTDKKGKTIDSIDEENSKSCMLLEEEISKVSVMDETLRADGERKMFPAVVENVDTSTSNEVLHTIDKISEEKISTNDASPREQICDKDGAKLLVDSRKTLNSSALQFFEAKQDAKINVKTIDRLKLEAKEAALTGNRIYRVPSSTLRDYVDIEVPKEICFLQENVEAVLCTSDDPKNCQGCREDLCRACFVLRYFPLLDLSKIRTVLGWKQGCRWRTWLAYLIHLEDATFSQDLNQAILDENHSKIARSLRDTSSIELLFSCVRRLLPSSLSLIFDLCTEKDVYPWEVCFIYMINVKKIDSLTNFLHYVTTMRRIKPMTNPLGDTSVAMTILYCSLKFTSNSNNIKTFYCDCGAAREGSHLLPWQKKELIDDVISFMVSKNPDSGLVIRAFDLCRRYGYWYGCIKILRIRKEHHQSFELITQLGDFKLLDEYVKAESFSIAETDLKYLCSLLYHKGEDGARCQPAVPGFAPTINNESLGKLLIRELGPNQALSILKCFKNDEFALTKEFYFDCMKVAEKEVLQRQLVRNMIEELNNEVCQENKSVMQRQIEVLKNKELSGDLNEQHSPVKDEAISEDLQNSVPINHWGINLRLSSSDCPCCTMPLCMYGASTSAGIIAFDCGHTYHKHCLPEEACLVCYYKINSCLY